MFQRPVVSIIVVTYNNADVIGACLQALLRQSFCFFEVLLVDNASQDETLAVVERDRGEFAARNISLQVLPQGVNFGFAGGNRLGVEAALGEMLVLLNPDTEAAAGWLQNLVEAAAADASVGIAASKLLVYDSGKIDSAGDGCMTSGRGFKRGEGQEASLYARQEYVFGACGGAMLIKKTVLKDVGFLDERFFLIYEDVDFCFRSRLAGWKTLFVPSAIVYHKVRTSICHLSDIAVYYSVRNAKLVWLKNMPLALVLRYLHHVLLQEVLSFFYFCVKHQKWRAFWQAQWSVVQELPGVLRQRKKIQERKRLTVRELDQELTSLFQKELFKKKICKFFGLKS